MSTKKSNSWRLQAKILGRVERLLGSDSDVNPYSENTEQWEAFREGWFRDVNNPLSGEIRIRGI